MDEAEIKDGSVGVNQATDRYPGLCVDSTGRDRAELAIARRELARANQWIDKLLCERKRNRRTITRLTRLASTDVLTNLANRRRFDRVLKADFARSVMRDTPISVIMVDVDRFKSYNDTFGHAAGDVVLCAVGRQLVKSGRPRDIVARYGGDEFAILLREAGLDVATYCAERCRDAIMSIALPNWPVTASVGMATRTESIKTADSLVEEADRALYHAKRSGRSRTGNVRPAQVRRDEMVSLVHQFTSLAWTWTFMKTNHAAPSRCGKIGRSEVGRGPRPC